MKQTWNAKQYAQGASYVPKLGKAVLEWLAPQPGERILDLGCGDGALTQKLYEAGCEVVGVDSSAALVAAARARGLDARHANGEALNFHAEFNAVFSNAALHWMKNSTAVLSGVRRALRPGGRFVGELGCQGNLERVQAAIERELQARGLDFASLNPWFFPSTEEYRALLLQQGFSVKRIICFDRPTPLTSDWIEWLNIFATFVLKALPSTERASFCESVQQQLLPQLRLPDGSWQADYVRLRFSAELPGN